MMGNHSKDVLQNIKAQELQNSNVDRTKFTIKAIILIIFNFLVILLIIWLLHYFNSYDTKIIKTVTTTVGDGYNGAKGIINFFKNQYPILKYIKIIFWGLILTLIHKIYKLKENYNENLSENDRLLNILSDYLSEDGNIFKNESNDNILEMLDELLNNPESENNLITQNITESPINNQENLLQKLNKSILISSTMLSISTLVASVVPKILESI